MHNGGMTQAPDLSERGRRERRFWIGLATVFALGLASVLLVHAWSGHRRGDPDPGHRRINALRPVLTAVPVNVQVENRDIVNPKWDSCDGKQHGWNSATVDTQFTSSLSPTGVVAHVSDALHSKGWTYEPANSGGGAWYWHKTIEGSLASVQFLGGPDAQPSDWDLQASVDAATHALKC